MDYNTGMIKAREEGERKGKIEVAKRLIKLGISIDKIKEATELTKEEIEELK